MPSQITSGTSSLNRRSSPSISSNRQLSALEYQNGITSTAALITISIPLDQLDDVLPLTKKQDTALLGFPWQGRFLTLSPLSVTTAPYKSWKRIQSVISSPTPSSSNTPNSPNLLSPKNTDHPHHVCPYMCNGGCAHYHLQLPT